MATTEQRKNLTPEENRALTNREVADALDAHPSEVSGVDAKPTTALPAGSPARDQGVEKMQRLSEDMRRLHGRPAAPATVVKAHSSALGDPLVNYWIERAIEINHPHQGAPGARSAQALELAFRHRLSTPSGFAAFVREVQASWK